MHILMSSWLFTEISNLTHKIKISYKVKEWYTKYILIIWDNIIEHTLKYWAAHYRAYCRNHTHSNWPTPFTNPYIPCRWFWKCVPNSPEKWLHNRICCPSDRSKQIQETHTAYSAGTQYTRQSLNEEQHTWLRGWLLSVCEAMYVVFHSNLATFIVCRRYKPCEFLGSVWTDCWGNKSHYVITSLANGECTWIPNIVSFDWNTHTLHVIPILSLSHIR